MPAELVQVRALQHAGAQCIDHRREGQRSYERLQERGKPVGRKEHTREDPHGHHGEVHQPRYSFDRAHPRRDKQTERAEGQRRQQGTTRPTPRLERGPARQMPAGRSRPERSPRPQAPPAWKTGTTANTASEAWARRSAASAAFVAVRPRWRNPGPRCRCPSGSSQAGPAPGSRCSGSRARAPIRLTRARGPARRPPSERRDRPATTQPALRDWYRRIDRPPCRTNLSKPPAPPGRFEAHFRLPHGTARRQRGTSRPPAGRGEPDRRRRSWQLRAAGSGRLRPSRLPAEWGR